MHKKTYKVWFAYLIVVVCIFLLSGGCGIFTHFLGVAEETPPLGEALPDPESGKDEAVGDPIPGTTPTPRPEPEPVFTPAEDATIADCAGIWMDDEG